MKVKVLNASSKKTRNELRKAFAELLEEKKIIKNITIKELVNKAGITRATFYTHYDNIYEIAEEIQDDFIQVVFHNIDNLNSKETLRAQIERIANHLKENEEMYCMLLASDETLIFINRLNRLMTKNLSEFIIKHKCEDRQLDINFYVDGITSISVKYFRNELNTSIDELSEYAIDLYERLFK